MDEAKLLETLGLVEALYAGAGTDGEKGAAGRARDRLLKRLQEFEKIDPAVEYKFSLGNQWSRQLFLALLRRYELHPYRRPRQRYTTVMVMVPKTFVDKTLWPQFVELSEKLESYLSDVTQRVIAEVLQSDGSEAEVTEQKYLDY